MKSCLYEGWIRHRRYQPKTHAIRYAQFMWGLDLAELPALFEEGLIAEEKRYASASFLRKDFLGNPTHSLQESVRDLAEQHGGRRPTGRIVLITHLRYLGYIFNPVNLYVCYADQGDEIETVLAHVTNTPWGEKHLYLLPNEIRERPGRFSAINDKQFHVSPFMEMEMQYHWRLARNERSLVVHIENHKEDQLIFDATLSLRQLPLTHEQRRACLRRYPLMTFQVLMGIYWEAVRLWRKGLGVYDHP